MMLEPTTAADRKPGIHASCRMLSDSEDSVLSIFELHRKNLATIRRLRKKRGGLT